MEQEIQNLKDDSLQLNQEAIEGLTTASSWAKFFAVLMIIGAVFMFLAGIAMATAFSFIPGASQTQFQALPFPPALFGVIYFIIGGFYIWLASKLLKFSNNAKEALRETSEIKLGVSLKNLGSYFKVIGIMIIVFIAFYIIAIISFGIFGAMASNSF